jgi:dTDP-4-dehydrorhamnose 3,5-epimerase
MTRLVTNRASIEGLFVIQRQPLSDDRGSFQRLFCVNDLSEHIGHRRIQQINHTRTRNAGTVRGLHFQRPPHAELKLVSCLRGAIFDVAVDLRRDSPTFLKWHSEILSENNYNTLLIPEGFAHGFQTLTPDCELIYFHTEVYCSEDEMGLNAIDPCLAISWPLLITQRSIRDQQQPMLDPSFRGLRV